MIGLSGCQSTDNNSNNRTPTETENKTSTEPGEDNSTEDSPTSEENNSTENNGTESTTPDETTSTEDGFDGKIHSFTFSTTPDRIDIPGVWTSADSFEDYHVHTSIEVAANQELGDISLENNDRNLQIWETTGTNFSTEQPIPFEQLEEENRLEVDLGDDWTQEINQTDRQNQVEKQIPEVYTIDFRHGENTELRNEIGDVLENPEEYLSNAEEQVTDSVTTSYESPDELEYDKKTIDLAALDFHHRNNYLQMGTWVHDIIETLDKDDLEVKQELRKARNNELTQKYPDPHDSFSFEAFQEAESLVEGHKMLMPYIANFEWTRGENLHSTKDKNYAAIIQEAFDRFNENVDVHVWAFKVGFGVHGNGLMYDETNDSLHVMETVHAPRTGQGLDPVPIEESNYLDDHLWHPIQFKDQNYGYQGFESAKSETAKMINCIATKYNDNEPGYVPAQNAVLSTGLTKQVARALGEYNLPETDWEFDNIRNVARTMEKCRRTPGKYVIAGNSEEEIGASVYDITEYSGNDKLLDEVWKDEEGIYDNFEDILMEYEAGDYSSVTETAETLAS